MSNQIQLILLRKIVESTPLTNLNDTDPQLEAPEFNFTNQLFEAAIGNRNIFICS